MTKEQKCLEFIEILKNPDKIVKNEYGNFKYHKNGEIYFWYDPKNIVLYFSHEFVGSVFIKEYSLNYWEIKDLIQDTVKNAFNGMVVTTGKRILI